MNTNFKVNYLSRNFSDIRKDLRAYTKRFYGDKFADLSDASINSLMIDSVAYVGDILSYYLDYQANESFLATATEPNNVLNLAKELGYSVPNAASTTGYVTMHVEIPAFNNQPNYSIKPRILKGTRFTDSTGTKNYLLTEDILIDKDLVGSSLQVTETTFTGAAYYTISIKVPVISGKIVTKSVTIGDFIPFRVVSLDDGLAVEIISVVDSENNNYWEVPNLAQNIVYRSFYNSLNDSSVRNDLRPVLAQRRFVYDTNNGDPQLVFGGKQYRPDDDLEINPLYEPSKFIFNNFDTNYPLKGEFSPARLLNNDLYGFGPDNTTLTVTYRTNTNINTAVPGEINVVKDLAIAFGGNPNTAVETRLKRSIRIKNEESIVGENAQISLQDVKDIAGIVYQAQNRAVTAKDYEALAYLMPGKYGAIKRAKAVRDPNSLKNNINMYVVCEQQLGDGVGLVKANTKLKENLKNWLAEYKMITDTIDILDAKIINLKIRYKILCDPNFSKSIVNAVAKQEIARIFATPAEVGQNLDKLNIYRALNEVEGVLDVKEIYIENATGVGYSQTALNIEENTSKDDYTIFMPKNAIYEIRYPSGDDILGETI